MITGVLILVLLGSFSLGVYEAVRHSQRRGKAASAAGWLYFIGNGKETPIKVGMSRYDPVGERLADLKTMSPLPLRVLYKMPVGDRWAAERAVHETLAPYRQHGEWFDRDATLAYIDHLKGAYR